MVKSERRSRELERGRAEIIQQAEVIFAANGFHKATMAEIAKAAGVATGSLYQFFRNKEDLFATMIEERTEAVVEQLVAAVAARQSASEKIAAFVNALLSLIQGNSSLLNMLIRGEIFTASKVSLRIRANLLEKTERQISIAEAILRQGVVGGEFRSGIDCRTTAMSLIGGLRFLVFYWIITDKGFEPMEKATAFLQTFMEGIKGQ